MRPQIELLKNHSKPSPDTLHLFKVFRHISSVAVLLHTYQLTTYIYFATGKSFQHVDARRKVLLPEPLAPIIAITSPSCASSEMPFRTSSLPKYLCRSSTISVALRLSNLFSDGAILKLLSPELNLCFYPDSGRNGKGLYNSRTFII